MQRVLDQDNPIQQVEGSDWTFIINANQDEVLDELPVLQRNIIVSAVVVLALSIVITYFIGNSIAKPIIATVGHSEKLANLDLTEDVPENLLNNRDETGDLARAFQNLMNSLRDIINDINNSSEQVASSSEELTATSQQSASTEQIAGASEGLSQLAQNLQEIISKFKV